MKSNFLFKGYVSLWYNEKGKIEYIDKKNRIVSPVYCVKAHKKAITDVEWHPTEPFFITNSIRPPVKVWDIRDPLTPISEFPYIYSLYI